MRTLKLALALSTVLALPAYAQQGNAIGPTGGGGSVTCGPGITGCPSGPLAATAVIRAVTGTTDTILSSDATKLVTYSNASTIAVTLPQATGSFAAGFGFSIQNKGVGSVTVTPTTSTVNGVASLVIPTNMGCDFISDGTNWQVAACTALVTASSGYRFSDVQAIANKWYNTQGGGTANGLAAGTTTTYFVSFTIDKAATLDFIGGRTAVIDAAGHWRGGVYLEDATTHRPTGSPLCTTADLTLAAGSYNAACAAVIPAEGRVWLAFQTDSATGAITASLAGSYNGTHIGTTSQIALSGSGVIAGTNYTVNSTTYGTFPTFPASTLSEAGTTGLTNYEMQIHIITVP